MIKLFDELLLPRQPLDEAAEGGRSLAVLPSRKRAESDARGALPGSRREPLLSASNDVTKITDGDVFRVTVDVGRAYIGQVLHVGESAVFIVVFDHLVQNPVAISDALDALVHQPIVASWTNDARFRPGMWKVITEAQTDTRRYLPASTWGLPETGGVRLTSFDETRTRSATAEEAATIPPRTTRSPMLIEKFLMMSAGVEPSNPALEKVRWVSMPSSAELFPE
ncbi:hypothetical protein [Curtobacterium oceanosedimentum]|uniref:Uncharacterized protein n=1 Tax=Curtobacterium oceanosedimentum TaxID=465820 RepID=A0A147DNS3_9MICO|nr:hypothetical protein [Curtobacterium oceanosedimentum]KTR51037.1 hypothetical protein NS359_12375 [Curtobacterium oceanosedimentum]